jgi:hypothetical protein
MATIELMISQIIFWAMYSDKARFLDVKNTVSTEIMYRLRHVPL